jgi:hypothetical protein
VVWVNGSATWLIYITSTWIARVKAATVITRPLPRREVGVGRRPRASGVSRASRVERAGGFAAGWRARDARPPPFVAIARRLNAATHVPHDEHFLERLDRVSDSYDELELALGLYRDHELVRFVLDHVRLPEGAERVAFALTPDQAGPHIIVARDGGFVTCLGAGMKVGQHPVVSRAHLDALAAKHERVRAGLALARKRGTDSTALLKKMTLVGPAFPREDFLAAEAAVGPAAGALLSKWNSWTEAMGTLLPVLLRTRIRESARPA